MEVHLRHRDLRNITIYYDKQHLLKKMCLLRNISKRNEISLFQQGLFCGKPWGHFRPLSFAGAPYRPPQQPSHFVYPLKNVLTFSATHRQGDLSHPQVPLAGLGLALPPGLLSSFRYQPTNLRTRRLHAQCPLIMRMIIIARRCFHRRDCTHVDWLDKLFFAFVFLFCC